MRWSKLTPTMAYRCHEEMITTGGFAPAGLSADNAALRERILQEILVFDGSVGAGAYDVAAGLALYRILGEAGMDVRTAADDSVWRFLSLRVVPDLVEARWPNAPAVRFWRSRSRIWLRVIWWLVHLTWQENEEQTRAVLADVTTDTIAQLVERPGRGGFRVELMRALFRERIRRHFSQDEFRALMKLNTARVVVTEPWFCDGGIGGYARELHDYVASVR
ncbi:hypothetical protein O0881_04250 [Janthinobacterium sp. SUN100]|uniref:hypothetical protein n=1 Tax=Janthinobacterium sp. SUN100 TaxID=3004101 RepID=UPI0025B25CBE|nr:hypothetical protein [Janthinobacterium sp. SUN100]MDN2701208.1 hypothetical protein [Janthinobacterium sp. SUN100]